MNPQAPQHQRVRFRRREIIDLDSLPSAVDLPAAHGAGHARGGLRRNHARRALRWLGLAAGSAAALAVLAVLAVAALGASPLGKEKLRAAAERALERAVGRDLATSIGATTISLDGSHLIGLAIADVGLQAVGQPKPFATAASVRFGIELLPLLSGRLVLSGASLADASFDAGALGSQNGGDWLRAVKREDGLIDPDRSMAALFGALHGAFTALERDFSGEIELSDVSVLVPAGQSARKLTVVSAQANSSGAGSLAMQAQGEFDGCPWTLSGSAERDAASKRIATVDLDLSVSDKGAAGNATVSFAALRIGLRGEEGTDGAPSSLLVQGEADGLTLGSEDDRGGKAGNGAVVLSLRHGTETLQLERLAFSDPRSSFDLSGTIGLRAAGDGEAPAYAFDLSGSDLALAAADSPEKPFAFGAKLAGRYEPAAGLLRAETIELQSGEGSVGGSAGVRFATGKSPGVDLTLAVASLPVAGVKQLWPWFAARGARNWVQNHASGGTVEEGRLDYHMAPGRVGSGVPPSPDELRGSFTITGMRFDTAGAMPAAENADGIVSFAGTDADIAVSHAEMALPSGLRLASSRGALSLRAVNRPPLIGRLDLDVEGEAAAAAELAGLEPVDALKRLPFGAADLSGRIKARVETDVPLQRGVPRESLDFHVAADFADLAIAKPVEGQLLREAQGTLDVVPDRLTIQAAAKLNGAPAKLALTEPLRKGGPARSRKIELNLDDKTRGAVAPGLSILVSGKTVLEVDASGPDRQVRVDLGPAKLSAPWVGWSKGAGVPARASFTMRQEDGRTAISDLELAGDTFRLSGSVALDKGGLVSARFPSLRLNRDDELAVSVKRDGSGGFAVAVSGNSYDARALVKSTLASAPAADPGEARRGETAGADLSLTADLRSAEGFGRETLSGVSVAYHSHGSSRALRISGTTDTGAAVNIGDATQKGERRVEVKTADAGSLLRFLNLYGNMRGGRIEVALAGPTDGTLRGHLDARSFALVDEARLRSLVSSRGGNGRSLQEAVRRDIDTSRVTFDRASASLEKGRGTLAIRNGVLRGTAIGSTFQGTVYDERGRMDMTGTFMPAYGLNRLFGELPLIGLILGNGEDRGLIGVTFKLEGDAKAPTVTVNPLSVIAPGIFRQIFQFD